MKVLVVDDDSLITDLLESLLEDWGHEPQVFNRGIDALAAITQDDSIKIAILDWNLPITNASIFASLSEKKRGDGVLRHNAYQQWLRIACPPSIGCGANNYVVKPFEPNDLKARIEAGEQAIAQMPKDMPPNNCMILSSCNLLCLGLKICLQVSYLEA